MTTKNEIVYSLLNIIRQGQLSNTEPLSEELISWEIDNTRAKLIRQDLNKKRSINPDLVQTLCIDVELADASDCPCVIAGCDILKTKQAIPPAIEIDHKNLVISVGSVNLSQPRFNLIPYERALFYNSNKFSNGIPAAFLHNGFFYIIGIGVKFKMIEHINIQIILEKPEDAKSFQCTGTPCYDSDSKYPISAAMIPDLQGVVIQNMLKLAAQAPSDQTSDLKHNLQQNLENQ
jgi:hypothetical protein